ncbi:helix-turn-helix domain-containing protein [Longirhabdus pacifica]|uniref:helix-turn-helix domain-containing protein n=1 Tax=Longirhabdus pacifica TaxID=2305227 RepID=UPI0013E8C1BA|nr:helix-turn-helix transcriptional regulator [Longirhabdus pacifica]
MKKETLGELVRRHRKQQNMTMGQVQEITGMSKGVISKLENGETKRPELNTIFTISDALHIPHDDVIDRYVNVEQRPHILQTLLVKSISIENNINLDLVKKVALAYLQCDRHETEDALASLYTFTSTIDQRDIKLALYGIITEYARLRGVPPYIAKGLLQVYFIKRLDIQKDQITFNEGKELLHYINFLNEEEQSEYYFKMAIQAYALKLYEYCIELVEEGLSLPHTVQTEIEARAYGTMINAYFELENYNEVKVHLHIFVRYKYHFVESFVRSCYRNLKVVTKDYDGAIPMLVKAIEASNQEQRIYAANDLIRIYIKISASDHLYKLLKQEKDFLPINPRIPPQYFAIAQYYEYKGNFQMQQGLRDKAMSSYTKSMEALQYINATEEMHALQYRIILQTYLNMNR